MSRTIHALAIGGLLLAGAAAAQARPYSVQRHATIQQERINQGRRSGSLTQGEAGNLNRREDNIQGAAAQDRAANGGTLTRRERVDLGARQAALSARIAVDKHNGATAPAAPPQ